MHTRTKTTIALTGAALVTTAALTVAPMASATSCAEGEARFEGVCGVATVVIEQGMGRPKPGSGGLIFRDEQANNLGSGMYENARFTTTGNTVTVNGIKLIEVEQISQPGLDGYGPLYKGYVKEQYTEINY